MSRSISIALLSLSLIMLIPALSWSSETRDFKVSSFIPEHFSDLVWTIDGKFNLSGNDRVQEQTIAPGFELSGRDQDQSSSRQSIALNTDATYYYETIKRQFELNIGFGGDLGHYTSEDNNTYSRYVDDMDRYRETKQSRLNYNLNPNLSGTVRQYAGDQLFGEFSIYINYRDAENSYNDRYTYDYQQQMVGDLFRTDERATDQENSSGSQTISSRFELSAGVGHVYEGSFAVTALYFIDKLLEANLLRREPSKSQMMALTELVYYYRQTHAVDDRYHRQDALNDIVDFLVEERIARDLDSRLLYELQDVWDYYPSRRTASRLFGFRLKAGIGYVTSYYKTTSTTDNSTHRFVEEYDPYNPEIRDTLYIEHTNDHSHYENKVTDELPYFMASGEYHYPINHLWQFDAAANLEVTLEDYSLNSGTRQLRDNRHRFNTTTTLTRFFDSRTLVRASINSDLFFSEDDIEASLHDPTYPDTRHVWNTDLTIGTGLSVLYRIAVPTTLDITAKFTSRFVRQPGYAYDYSNDYHSYSITAGIKHFIY